MDMYPQNGILMRIATACCKAQEQSGHQSTIEHQALCRRQPGSWAARREEKVSSAVLRCLLCVRDDCLIIGIEFSISTQRLICWFCVQDCKKREDHVAAIYALGTTAAPTWVARAYAVQQTLAAIDIVGAAASSATVIEHNDVLEEGYCHSLCMEFVTDTS